MPEIHFTVDNQTGDVKMQIKGVKGKACQPIHDVVSADLSTLLGMVETRVEDTPEMREQAVHVRQDVRARTNA